MSKTVKNNHELLCYSANRLLMIVPTRGRPQNAEAVLDAWTALSMSAAGDLLFAVDEDDPALKDYLSIDPDMRIYVGPRRRLGGTLNFIAARYADVCDAIGFMGDDHSPRTQGFETRFMAELDRLGTGVVYGNDLIQGPNLPTAVAMTSDIIRTLGYMVPAGLVHMYADNAWKAWGEGIGRLSYLPDVVIEHVHPLAGKVPDDEGYREAAGHMESDAARWNDYRLLGGLAADIERLRAMVAAKKPLGDVCPNGHELSGPYSTVPKLDRSPDCTLCSSERGDEYLKLAEEDKRAVAAL
jgi:hypothetical protein